MCTETCSDCAFCEPTEACMMHEVPKEEEVIPPEAGGKIYVDFNNQEFEIE